MANFANDLMQSNYELDFDTWDRHSYLEVPNKASEIDNSTCILNPSKPISLVISQCAKLSTVKLDNVELSDKYNGMLCLPHIFATLTNITHFTLTNSNLQQIAHLPPNVIFVDLSCNKISRIDCTNFAQNNTIETLILSNNLLQHVDLTSVPSLIQIDIDNNMLLTESDLVVLNPNNICKLDVSFTCFADISSLSLPNLCILNIDGTLFDSIDNLPDSITELKASSLDLKVVSKLPHNLVKFIALNSHITKFTFEYFPESIQYVDLYGNSLVDNPKNKFKHDVLKFDIRCNPCYTNPQKDTYTQSTPLFSLHMLHHRVNLGRKSYKV